MTLYCWSSPALMMMMLSLLGMVVVMIPKGRKFYGLWLLLCPFQSTAVQTAAPNNWLEISNIPHPWWWLWWGWWWWCWQRWWWQRCCPSIEYILGVVREGSTLHRTKTRATTSDLSSPQSATRSGLEGTHNLWGTLGDPLALWNQFQRRGFQPTAPFPRRVGSPCSLLHLGHCQQKLLEMS